MVKYALVVSAILTNVTDLRPIDNHDMIYKIRFGCDGCGWEASKASDLCVSNKLRTKFGSRKKGAINAEVKCQGDCRKKQGGSIWMITGSENPITAEDCNDVVLVELDCDGITPRAYQTNGGWLATTARGEQIEIYLDEGEYDQVVDGQRIAVKITKSTFV